MSYCALVVVVHQTKSDIADQRESGRRRRAKKVLMLREFYIHTSR